MTKCRPHFEECQSFYLILQSGEQCVKFDIQMYHHEIPQGWEIMPCRQPLEVRNNKIG